MACHLKDAVESGLHHSSEAVGRRVPRQVSGQAAGDVSPPIGPKGKFQRFPELFTTPPTDRARDLAALESAIERAADKGPPRAAPASDVFGELSGKECGALFRTHIAHRLKPFGA
jgi:hypothetical protein